MAAHPGDVSAHARDSGAWGDALPVRMRMKCACNAASLRQSGWKATSQGGSPAPQDAGATAGSRVNASANRRTHSNTATLRGAVPARTQPEPSQSPASQLRTSVVRQSSALPQAGPPASKAHPQFLPAEQPGPAGRALRPAPPSTIAGGTDFVLPHPSAHVA
jgi:hypothetical protein